MTNTRDDKYYWLALKLVPRLAVAKKLALVEQFGLSSLFSPASPLTSSHGISAKQLSAFSHPDWQRIEKIIDESSQHKIELIGFNHAYYPKQLQQIYDPPLVIFAQGNLSLLTHRQIAVVGSRYSTVKGRETAQDLAQQLVQAGFVITSGLALGIDAAAHQGALNYDNATIAVVATGLDIVYPARHRSLAASILAKRGLIVSEFYPGTQPKAGHFPKRNRLISGLSEGVVVVEAELKSGSLITARCALEQNREVFAIPSSIDNPQAKGCHFLIKQGAKLVETSADIIEELVLDSEPRLYLTLAQKEKNQRRGGVSSKQDEIKNQAIEKSPSKDLCNDLLLASVGFEITPVDKVVSRSKLPIEEVVTRLTMLELSGLISAVPGGYIKV